jgi:membrane associated rhomboid family serine protease
VEASDPELLRAATWQLSLVEGAPGRLLRLDRDAAWIALPKLGAVLITSEHSPERLRLQAAELVERARGTGHLLVLGGGTELRELLIELEAGSDKLGCLQVDFWGKTWPSAQPELGGLDLRLDPPEVESYLASARAAVAQAQQMSAWQDRVQGRKPWATWSLCGVFAALWLAQLAMGGPELLPIVTRMGGLTEHTLSELELYRLATASLLHLGWGHVGFAVIVMWQLGGFLERILGPWRFLILVFVSALGGTLMALPTALGGGLVAGSSTALWGVLVGHFVLAYRPRGLLPDALLPQARKIARNNLVLNALVSLLPGVSLLGHLGGGLAGLLLLGPGLLTWGLAERKGERAFRGFASLLVGGFAASLVLALGQGQPWLLLEAPELSPRKVAGEAMELDVPVLLGAEGRVHGDLILDPLALDVQLHKADSAEAWVGAHMVDGVGHSVRTQEGYQVDLWAFERGGAWVSVEVVTWPEAHEGWLRYAGSLDQHASWR